MCITKEMYELLKSYEAWEAKLLDSNGPSIIDEMTDDEYETLIKLQNKRNELICRWETTEHHGVL